MALASNLQILFLHLSQLYILRLFLDMRNKFNLKIQKYS